MSISTLYRTLVSNGYYASDQHRRMEILENNEVIRVENNNLELLHTCMALPGEILEKANHSWYQELAIADSLTFWRGQHEDNKLWKLWLPWVAHQLNKEYHRPISPGMLRATFIALRKCFAMVINMPFNKAMRFVISEIPGRSEAQHAETFGGLLCRASNKATCCRST